MNDFGPRNPHPVSQLKTELVWEGEYDEYGRRHEIDVAGAAPPLQKIETIDERGQPSGTFFPTEQARKLGNFDTLLIWGDNKLAMASFLKDFKRKIHLIYIDPPFDVGADFTMEALERKDGC